MSDTKHIIHKDGTYTNVPKSANPAGKPKKKGGPGRPFKKGVAANPAGKPKGTLSLITILRRQLQEVGRGDKQQAEVFIESLIRDAIDGSSPDRKLIFDRLEGLPKQSIELESVALPFTIIVQKDDSGSKKSPTSANS